MDTVSMVGVSAVAADSAVSQGEDRSAQSSQPEIQDSSSSTPTTSLDKVVEEINNSLALIGTALSFSVDKDSGEGVIKVLNEETKEVIRQIPPENVLRIAAHIKDLLGILYDDKK